LTMVLEEARLERNSESRQGQSRLDSLNRIELLGVGNLIVSPETFQALDLASLRSSLDNGAGLTSVVSLLGESAGAPIFSNAKITIAANGTGGGTANLLNLRNLGITQTDNTTTPANEQDRINTVLPGTTTPVVSNVGANLLQQVGEVELQVNLSQWLTTPAEQQSAGRLRDSLLPGAVLTLNPDSTASALSAQQLRDVFPLVSTFGLSLKPNSIAVSESNATNLQGLFTGASPLTPSQWSAIGSLSGSAGSVTLNGNQLNAVLSSGLQPQQRLFSLADTAAGLRAFITAATDGSTVGTQLTLAGVSVITRTDTGAPIRVSVREFEFLRTQQAQGLTLPNRLLQIEDSQANLQAFINTAFTGSALRAGTNLNSLLIIGTQLCESCRSKNGYTGTNKMQGSESFNELKHNFESKSKIF